MRPASEIATVSAEKTTVRPARFIVAAVAAVTWAVVASATAVAAAAPGPGVDRVNVSLPCTGCPSSETTR